MAAPERGPRDPVAFVVLHECHGRSENADVLYIMNAPIMEVDRRRPNFTTLPAMHGDNHQLWINPKNPAT